jgi:hypothetical protein
MSNLDSNRANALAGNRSKSSLTAFFDRRSEAEAAIDRLQKAGVADVRLLPGYEAEGAPVAPDSTGFWVKLEDWLFPDDDRSLYAEGLRRGGFLVSASVDDTTYETAHDILDDEGAIDMDERADLWRTDGWGTPEQEAATSRQDVFNADAATGAATGVGRYIRKTKPTSSGVRSYELREELPDDIVDDVLPTGHQRTVDERRDPGDDGMDQSQGLDDLRQKQSFPGGR